MRALRGSAWLIIAAALLPLFLLLIFQIAYSARDQRQDIENRAQARAEAVILAADARVERTLAGIDALATSPSLTPSRLAEFGERTRELARLNGDWRSVELIDQRTGRLVLEVGSTPERLESRSAKSSAGSGSYAGFGWGPGCPCVVFERRAPPGTGHYLIRILVDAGTFVTLLPPTRSEYPVSAIVDPAGRFIARSVNMKERFAGDSSRFLRTALTGDKDRGIYSGTTLEGLDNYSAFARSRLTGWSAHLAMRTENIDNPARRFFASLGLAALLSLLLAAGLTAFALRQLAESRRLDERLEQSQKMEALGQLTGGIAHDFNNLLTPIVGSLDLITRRAELDDRTRRLAESGLAAAMRAAKLTKQLLAFSRRQKLALEVVDLGAMISEMEPILSQSTGDLGLELDLEEAGCWVRTDITQLELALINLILNARDAAPAGSVVRIGLERVEQDGQTFCRLEIADQGPGMPEEVRRRAFEPFFTTKPQGKGTGLGLAQVYALAHQSGGSATIDSAPGEGTRIALIFPACDPPADPDSALDEADFPVRPVRILVAEDEKDVRATLVAALEEDGHEVVGVANGQAALERLGDGFDLLVADFAMPGMSGAELIATARERHPQLNFLIVTGYLDSAAVEGAAPGTPVIAKPFDSAGLRRRVRQLFAAPES